MLDLKTKNNKRGYVVINQLLSLGKPPVTANTPNCFVHHTFLDHLVNVRQNESVNC